MSRTDLAEAHTLIPATHSARLLREAWGDLTPEQVKFHATRAYGTARGDAMMVEKVEEVQARKGAGE